MKYGMIYHRYSKNIGDDVQSYAASRLLPQVDYLIEREKLDLFASENDEPVAAIMSAWYMWAKWHWPPSTSIHPLFVGFHYSDLLRGRPAGMPIRFDFLKGLGADYLRAQGPIGCRDTYTLELLQQLEIESYFAGCVTLTLDPPREPVKPEREYICLVDVDEKAIALVQKQLEGTDIEIRVVPHIMEKSLINVPWEQRQATIEELLSLYQNAKCVVTFRLHCLLPCLAMRTPVLLMRENFDSPRFQPYHTWAHKTTTQDYLDGKCDYSLLSPPPNPETYKETRDALKQRISQFLGAAAQDPRRASEISKAPYSAHELMAWQHETMRNSLDNWLKESRSDWAKLGKQAAQIAEQKAKIGKQQREIAKQKEELEKQTLELEKRKQANAKLAKALKAKPKAPAADLTKMPKPKKKKSLFGRLAQILK